MKKILLQSIVIMLSYQVFGQTTIENFVYGTVTGTSADTITNPAFGGTVWRQHSGLTGQVVYKATSLSYPGYGSSNIGGSAGFTFGTGFSQDIHRRTVSYNSGSVYTSFLLNMAASGGAGSNDSYFFHVLDTVAMTSFRCRVYVKDGSVANTFKIGLTKGSNTGILYSTADYPINSTVLVVLKYKFDPVNSDSAFAYVFTSGIPTTEPSVATLTATDLGTGDLATFNAVAIRQHPSGSTMNGTIDGIRVSNTWNEAPLPVTLNYFGAEILNNKSTLLSWSTSSEANNSGFEVEQSFDGVDFKTIGFVKGAGNSKNTIKYSFAYLGDETAFYRLKQIDFDGKATYSDIVSVENTEFVTDLTPNPFNDYIEIATSNMADRAEILDLMGKVVLSETINNTIIRLNAKDLLNGVYFIKVYDGDEVTTKRIIKAN